MQGSDNKAPSLQPDAIIAQQEKKRQAYLGAMGIQTWYPRCQLLNAVAPRTFDWIVEDASEFTQQPETSLSIRTDNNQRKPETVHQPKYNPTRAADILDQFVATSESPEAITEPPSSASNTKSQHPVNPFRLIVEPIGNDCLVVAEMPHSGLNQFSRFHHRLLNDILRAVNLPPSTSQTLREFIWPISQNRGLLSNINQDDLAASNAVEAFLNNQYGLQQRKIIILLGQTAARFVIDPARKFEDLRGIKQDSTTNQCFAVSHGLNELMKQSSLKAEAWHDLAPLQSITTSATC